jgi:hypothetical protein
LDINHLNLPRHFDPIPNVQAHESNISDTCQQLHALHYIESYVEYPGYCPLIKIYCCRHQNQESISTSTKGIRLFLCFTKWSFLFLAKEKSVIPVKAIAGIKINKPGKTIKFLTRVIHS